MLFYILAALTVAALVGLDQWVKYWVTSHLALGETAPLWEGDYTWLLTAITALVLAAILFALVCRIIRHPLGRWSSVILFSGGLGNLIDRVRLGYVVDMFDFQFIRYPVFNVADMFVVAGVIGCAIYFLFLYEKYDADPDDD